MLIDMLNVREIVQKRLPNCFQLCACFAAVVSILHNDDPRLTAAALVCPVQIQPVNIERNRHSAEKFRREIPTRPNVEKSADEYILAAHQKEHTGNGNTVVRCLKQHGTG